MRQEIYEVFDGASIETDWLTSETWEAYKFSNCYVDNNEKERKRVNARIRERRQANKGMRKQSLEKY